METTFYFSMKIIFPQIWLHLPLQNSILSVSFNFSWVTHYPRNVVTYKKILKHLGYDYLSGSSDLIGLIHTLVFNYRLATQLYFWGWLDSRWDDEDLAMCLIIPQAPCAYSHGGSKRANKVCEASWGQGSTTSASCCCSKQVTSCWRRSPEDLTASGPINRTWQAEALHPVHFPQNTVKY